MSHIAPCTVCAASGSIVGVKVGDDSSRVCEECYSKAPESYLRYYRVPSDNLHVLTVKFNKLGRRAKRLNLAPPTFRSMSQERVVKTNPSTGAVEKVYMLHHIAVDAGISEVKVAGWTFIATVQCTEEGNIIRKVGQDEIPAQYRTISNKCDHCNTIRNRKDVYLLRHETEGYKVVGRNCLVDYFGTDALLYAERAQYLVDLSDSINEDDEFGFGGGGGPKYDLLEEYLSHVAQCIRLEGWMSRGRARQMDGYVQATADIAYLHMNPAARPPKWVPLYSNVEPESIELANNAIEWASEIEGEEIADYLHNIRVIARRGVVEGRDMGLGASIIAAYQRHVNSLRMKELQAKRAEIATYVGTVGERRLFKLFVENVIVCETAFGTSHLHMFGDKDGNVFKWFSSGVALEAGKEYLIKGTIKKQDEFRGVKQNMLSRCEEVEMKTFLCIIDGASHRIDALSETEAKKILRTKLNLAKLPRGAKLIEDKGEKEGAI